MSTILFDRIVYGPVHSRRLGVSLGINLSPSDGKRCTFNCIYCECGLNEDHRTHTPAPSRQDVKVALTAALSKNIIPDVITFSGNGEPTMHPDFEAIIDDVIDIRNRLCPEAKIAVLSNSTMLHKTAVMQALLKVDDNLMKFDAASDRLIELIDQPAVQGFTAGKLIDRLRMFEGKLTVQSIFLRGEHKGVSVDNTGAEDVEKWIDALRSIRPRKVMIYTIDRETPVKTLLKASPDTLDKIAEEVRKSGFPTSVSY
ncbi:MAG: radical SAM protein [Tannerella sp.]|nr:radical SAM protein [Tannerella sp.]